MARACVAVIATFVSTTLCTGPLLAQAVKAPPMTSVLAGKKFTPPVRGEALVEFTAPVTKREKDMVVTRITVRNASTGPIARLTVDETWYDKANAVITGGKGMLTVVLQPGEVQTVVIQTPFKPGMNANNFTFSHINGTVKPTRVPKLEAPPAAPAAPAAAQR